VSPDSPPRRFRDAHTHLAAGAADLADLDLRGATTDAEVLGHVSRAVGERKPGNWVRGWGWNGGALDGLDAAAPAHPVFLARRDGHAARINRAACAVLGVPSDRTIVDEAEFERSRRLLPPLGSAARESTLRSQLAAVNARGIAELDDFVEPWAIDLYARLADRGELATDVGLWLPDTLDPADAEAVRRAFPTGARPISVRGVKIFLDGTLSAHTAALWHPYADRRGDTGVLRMEEGEIRERVARWAAHDWPVALHAIGDRAVSLALDALEPVPRPRRGAHRIEHAQVVRHVDLPRFVRAGVVASVQPGHWRDDRPFLASRLGARSEAVVHPLASLVRAGATLLFGSDWPVSDYDPDFVVAAATDPERGDEALTRAATLACYTSGPR